MKDRQQRARERIDAARTAQERQAAEQRRLFDEKDRMMAARREAEQRAHEEEMRQRAEQQLAMALRRGKIMETMRQEEADRVHELVGRMSKQEEAMEKMAEQRRQMADLRDEERRLRQLDRQDNIERMMRAKDFHNDELKEKFNAADEREAARKAGKRVLIENHRIASLAATRQRQELVDKLASAYARHHHRPCSKLSTGPRARARVRVCVLCAWPSSHAQLALPHALC